MSEAIAAKLDEARALIEERGWTQERMRDAVGFCALGALTEVRAPYQCDILLDQLTGDILDFNDDPKRTKAEVIAAFKRAAELARAA